MNLDSALKYQQMGFSVIPIRPNKRPYLTTWGEYQKKKPTEDSIKIWWGNWPDANPGIVTGAISGLMVVDVDSEQGHEELDKHIPESLITPTSRTPGGGWHYYFAYQNGLPNKARIITDCDIRTDGGYIIAPPSRGENGKPYAWIEGLSIEEVAPAAMPDILYNNMHLNTSNRGGSTGVGVTKCHQMSSSVIKLFEEGSRDEALFHIANCLVKGGMEKPILLNVLSFIAENCKPPFPQKEVSIKIESAFNRKESRERNLAQEIRDFVLSSNGIFLSLDVIKCLDLSSRTEKQHVSNTLARFMKEGIVERAGNRNGQFRRIETEVEAIDFLNAETESTDLWLPFDINQMVEIMPGNIILLAGEPNAGKTGFLLNVIRQNMNKFKIHYFNSEMGSSELRKRLDKFEDIALSGWKFKPWERSGNFADVIKPGKDKINIIDYLEIHDNFYEVGGLLSEIHKKLKGAIAIVALQKNRGVDTGLGGFRSIEKPRLALAMSPGVLKIVKAKNWKTSENPNGKQIRFKIAAGCKLFNQGNWHIPTKD